MKNSIKFSQLSFLSLACLGIPASLQAGEISDPNYYNDFTSSASDFTTTAPTNGQWVLNTSDGGFFGHNDTSTVFGTYTASLQDTLLGGSADTAADFTFTSTVTFNADGVGSTNELGVAFLAGSSDLDTSNAYRLYIRGTANAEGSIFLMKNTTTVDSVGGYSDELRDFYGDTITYTVSGTYIDTNTDTIKDALSITATVYNITKDTSYSLSYQDSSPLVGNSFGFRDVDSSTYTFDAQRSSVSLVAIPEPATYASFASIVILGLAVVLRRSRNRTSRFS